MQSMLAIAIFLIAVFGISPRALAFKNGQDDDTFKIPVGLLANTPTPEPSAADALPTATVTPTPTDVPIEFTPTPTTRWSGISATNTPQPTPTPVVVIEYRDREIRVQQPEPVVTYPPYLPPGAAQATRAPHASPTPTPITSDAATKARFREQLGTRQRELPGKWIAVRNDARKQLTAKVKVADKRAIAERIIVRIEQVQTLRITTMAQQLDKLGSILDEAIVRGLVGGSKINEARNRIESARAALLSQAGKQYAFSLGSDKTLKTDMEKLVRAVEFDLKSVTEVIQAARRSVASAIGAK